MKKLSDLLNKDLIQQLRSGLKLGRFPGLRFKQAMQFLLTDGMTPASGLPIASLLALEDWVRDISHEGASALSYTTTELKNKTGEIVNKVLGGETVHLLKHGRLIAEIRKV